MFDPFFLRIGFGLYSNLPQMDKIDLKNAVPWTKSTWQYFQPHATIYFFSAEFGELFLATIQCLIFLGKTKKIRRRSDRNIDPNDTVTSRNNAPAPPRHCQHSAPPPPGRRRRVRPPRQSWAPSPRCARHSLSWSPRQPLSFSAAAAGGPSGGCG